MKKTFVSWSQTQAQVQEILRQMWLSDWRPDYVVGITRGGLIPATMISHYLGCPMHALQVSLRDGENCESNLWMAEDAFGYNQDAGRNILIVDDINDTGATLNWIQRDWPASCLPNDTHWNQVWGHNVRVAVMYDNESSECRMPISYSAVSINKAADPQWVVFPWEAWWQQ